MTDSCTPLEGDFSSLYGVMLGRKPPGSTYPLRHNLSKPLDCDGAGVTITVSTWEIHPDDDDGALTISGQTITGLTTRALVSGGTDGKLYRVTNNVTASDGTVVNPMVYVPIHETRARTA